MCFNKKCCIVSGFESHPFGPCETSFPWNAECCGQGVSSGAGQRTRAARPTGLFACKLRLIVCLQVAPDCLLASWFVCSKSINHATHGHIQEAMELRTKTEEWRVACATTQQQLKSKQAAMAEMEARFAKQEVSVDCVCRM
jgi:hypothetical protein